MEHLIKRCRPQYPLLDVQPISHYESILPTNKTYVQSKSCEIRAFKCKYQYRLEIRGDAASVQLISGWVYGRMELVGYVSLRLHVSHRGSHEPARGLLWISMRICKVLLLLWVCLLLFDRYNYKLEIESVCINLPHTHTYRWLLSCLETELWGEIQRPFLKWQLHD